MDRRPTSLILALSLAACSDDAVPEAVSPRDPQVAQALNDPLMTDPDLSARNEGAAALTVGSDFSVPIIPATPEEIARAKAEATEVLGGSGGSVALGEPDGETHQAFAAFLPDGCAKEMSGSAIWAARLPAAMPIYPRGHTIAARGSDSQGCKARIVTFTTPVSLEDVVAFYAARAVQVKMPAQVLAAGQETALAGGGGTLRYEVRARMQGDQTLVRIATVER